MCVARTVLPIESLQSEFGEWIPISLQSICRHWTTLLGEADRTDGEVMTQLNTGALLLGGGGNGNYGGDAASVSGM